MTTLTDLYDVAERTMYGPKVKEQEWNMQLFKAISEFVKEIGIKCPQDGKEFLCSDNSWVDDIFNAAIRFLTEQGVYCVTTGRVVKFTEEEIKGTLKSMPNEIQIGQGRDVRILRQRKIPEKQPLNICTGLHAPFSEDIAVLVIKNFAQIPRCDFIEGCNFWELNGKRIFGQPMEAYASIREVIWLREGTRLAGRPGMCIVYYPINTRASTMIAGINQEFGLRPTDGVLLSVLPDAKIEHDLLTAAIVYENYGASLRISGSFALAGGFCGGVEGAIIEGVIKPLIGILCYHDNVHYTGVEHIHTVSAKMRMPQQLSWATSIVNRVLNTKTNTICLRWVIPTSGPGTKQNLIEVAMRAIEAPLIGANLYAPRHSRTLAINAGQTPLEAEFMIEVSDATIRAGISVEEGKEILQKLAGRLEGMPIVEGYKITECYDLAKHKPTQQYYEVYKEVKRDLENLGLEFEC